MISGELSDIVRREMEKNQILNDELMALKSATSAIQQIQAEASGQQVCTKRSLNDSIDCYFDFLSFMQTESRHRLSTISEEVTKPENAEVLDSANEELNQLLVEAKTTIIDLQNELKVFKEKVETLQQQNVQYTRELAELKASHAAASGDSVPPITSIPLEPIVIIDTKADAKRACTSKSKRNRAQPQATAVSGRHSDVEMDTSDDDESSEDVNTYVVYECPNTRENLNRMIEIIFFSFAGRRRSHSR